MEQEDKLLAQHKGLIWSIVRRYRGRGVEDEDLYQLASIGLIKAARGYDSAYGTQFSTYAVPKIAGEIRRFLRDDGAVKVGRVIQERAYQLQRLQEQMELELGRPITISELAERAELSIEETAAAVQSSAPVQSLEAPAGEQEMCLMDCLAGSGGIEEEVTTKLSLRQAVAKLPERLAQVILMRYLREMTQQQTARVLGVSQVQVSRLERQAVALLRKELTDH